VLTLAKDHSLKSVSHSIDNLVNFGVRRLDAAWLWDRIKQPTRLYNSEFPRN